jgi:MFS family permease
MPQTAKPRVCPPETTRKGAHVRSEHAMNPVERRAVAALALLYSFRMLGLFMVLPLLALYAVDMPGASPLMIGIALGGYGLSQALLQIPLGWLSDHIGRMPVILGGLLVFALGSVVAGLADSVQGIALGRLLQGAGAIAGTLMALVADVTRERQRTKAMAMVGISIGLSFAVSLILGPVIAAVAGLSGVFLFTALLAISGMAVVYFGVPRGVRAGVHDEVGIRPGLILAVLADRRLQRLDFAMFSLHFILTASFLAIPFALEDNLGLARERHWQVYFPVLLASVLGTVVLLRALARGAPMRWLLLGCFALLPAAVGGITLVTLPAVICIALWVYFVSVNYLESALPSLVSSLCMPGGRGTALGVFSTCQFFGTFAGGLLGGLALQWSEGGGLFVLCAGLAAAAMLACRSVAPPAAPADSAADAGSVAETSRA